MDRHFLRPGATCGLVAVVLTMCGCSFFPEALQPQNLQKWNRGPGPSTDPFFSVPADRLAPPLESYDDTNDDQEQVD